MEDADARGNAGRRQGGAAGEVFPAIAVFCDPRSSPRPPPVLHEESLHALIRALSGINGYAPAGERRRRLEQAAVVAASETARLADGPTGPPHEIPEPQSPTQRYFRIRLGKLSAQAAWWHVLRVVRDSAADLVDAPLGGSDLQRLAAALAEVFSVAGRGVRANLSWRTREDHEQPQAVPPLDEMWLRRWVVAHQLHALLNLEAARALIEATAALRANDHGGAAPIIDRASTLVEAFAAARAQALALPPAFYEQTLRPTMLPPLTSVPLSGRMHIEYGIYQDALDELLALLPVPCGELAAVDPSLALARERLLDADLIEAERHVTSVEPLVGSSRSLVQSSKSSDNAVSVLRRIRHARAARAAPFVRFPDHDAGRSAHRGSAAVAPFEREDTTRRGENRPR